MKVLALILFSLVATSAALAQSSAQAKPSPTPRRPLAKPIVARGFEKFTQRDASARLIAAAGTRVVVDPDDRFTKGEEHYKAGRYKEAVAELRQAVRLSPDWDDPHYVLALALTELGELKEAIKEYQRVIDVAIKDDPKILAYYNMGNAYSDLGEYQNAIDSYQQAIKLEPTVSKPHNNLGLALAAVGRLSEAQAEFEEAVRLKPDYAAAHFNLGVAYLQLGRRREAESQLRILSDLKSDLAPNLDSLIRKY